MNRTMHMKRRRAEYGFTLLELLVVLMITALLASYVGPKLFGNVEQAKKGTAAAQMKTLSDVLHQYRLDTGSYPSEEEGLEALMTRPSNVETWRGPYLNRELPRDPWGHPYIWHNPAHDVSSGNEVELISYGADGQAGGEGKNEDIRLGF